MYIPFSDRIFWYPQNVFLRLADSLKVDDEYLDSVLGVQASKSGGNDLGCLYFEQKMGNQLELESEFLKHMIV